MTTMKAVVVHRYGGPEMLSYEDFAKPTPSAGEVLIKVNAAGVNPGEAMIRQGNFAAYHTLPFILGYDLAGTVAELGPETEGFAAQFALGDAVYATLDSTRNGSNAEFVTVRADVLVRRPSSLDTAHAASVPLSGLTAWQALFDVGGLIAGQTILVHGSGGAVGAFAVQFAKHKGAQVIATATGDDVTYVGSLGADTTVNYKTERFEEAAKGVDMVLDTIGGETQARSWGTLKPGGVLVATPGPPDQAAAKAHGVIAKMVGVTPNAAQLAEIGVLIDAGRVRTRVGLVLPLSEAQEAHRRMEAGGTRGKIVLSVSDQRVPG